jgi:WD40 repeat protein
VHSNLRLEAVSPRLKRELIHPNRNSVLTGLQFSPDSTRLIAVDHSGGVLMVWAIESGKQLTTIDIGSSRNIPPSGRFVVSTDWTTVYSPRYKEKSERVQQDGKKTVQWEYDGDVRAWDLATGRLRATYKHDRPRGIYMILLTPDGSKFVTFEELSGTDWVKRGISVWDARKGLYRSLLEGPYRVGVMSADGMSLAVDVVDDQGYRKAWKILDLATGREKSSLAVSLKKALLHSLPVFSPDGRLFVCNYDMQPEPKRWESCTKWYDTASAREVASFAAPRDVPFWCSQFSPNGQVVAAVSDRGAEKAELFLFSVAEKKLAKTVLLAEKRKGERLLAHSPVFSPDGKWLAVITQAMPDKRVSDPLDVAQGRIHLVDVAAGEIREILIAPQDFPRSACFSPDGRTLATGGLGRVLLWDLSTPPGALAGAKAP